MKCAKCGRERKQRWAGMRWNDKTICLTCWMDGWCFGQDGGVQHRDMVVSFQTALLLETNWREFADRNFPGDVA